MRIRMSPGRGAYRAVTTALMIAGAADAYAATIGYEVTAGVGQSDNIRRTEDNEQSDTIANAALQFSLDQRSERVDADVIAKLAYNDYFDDSFDSELLGNFVGDANFDLVHDRLDWVLNDNYGQVLTDPFAPPTPDTRENLNYLSTGPQLKLPVGSKTIFTGGARYLLTNYQDSPLDWSGFAGNAGAARAVSSSSSVGVNLNYQTVSYDVEALNADYDQTEAFATYDAKGARTTVKLDLGYTSIDRDSTGSKENGPLMRAELIRRVGTRSLVELHAGQQFANSGTVFSAQQTSGGIGLDAVPGRQTSEPFRDRYASLAWSVTGTRTRLSLSGSWRDQKYESQQSLDHSLADFAVNVSRDLSPVIALNVSASTSKGSFETSNSDYSDFAGRLGLQWHLSRFLVTNLSVDYTDRASDVVGGDYSETRIWLTFGYRYGEPRVSMRAPEFAGDRQNRGT
jgi:hypothetical protein